MAAPGSVVSGRRGGVNIGAPDAIRPGKTLAAYGGAEGGRDYNTVELSERTLWQTYMPPFEAAVKAGVAVIMASFNDIGGTPAHASDWLFGDVLRGRWGFKGLVVSDWSGIQELIAHGVAATRGEAGILALRAGVDVDMSDDIYVDSIAAAVRAGRLQQAFVDSSVHRLLRVKFELGSSGSYRFSDARASVASPAPEHMEAASVAAREAIVLLKNENRRFGCARRVGRSPSSDRSPTMRAPPSATGPLTGSRRRPSALWRESAPPSRHRRGSSMCEVRRSIRQIQRDLPRHATRHHRPMQSSSYSASGKTCRRRQRVALRSHCQARSSSWPAR